MKAKITEMQNSFIVETDNNGPSYHFLKTNPMSETLAKMKLDELQQEEKTKKSIDIFRKQAASDEIDSSASFSIFLQQKQLLEKLGVAEKNKTYKELRSLTIDLLAEVVISHMGEGEAEILFLLTKSDSMLVDIKTLEQIQSIIPIAVGLLARSERSQEVQFERLDAYIQALLFARASLQAAGVEVPA